MKRANVIDNLLCLIRNKLFDFWHDIKDRVSSTSRSPNMSSGFKVVISCMGVWQEEAMASIKFHPGAPSSTLLRPVGGLPLKQHYGYFMVYGHLLPFWTPHAVHL
jgi:hypothetical protein